MGNRVFIFIVPKAYNHETTNFHWHLISDHVFAFTDLSDTRNINLRTGFTLIFGCRESKGRNKKNSKGIKALPCVNDPYSKHRRRR